MTLSAIKFDLTEMLLWVFSHAAAQFVRAYCIVAETLLVTEA